MLSEPRVDADFYVPAPSVRDFLPFLDAHWRRQVTDREIDTHPFWLSSYPPNSPLTLDAAFDGMDVGEALDRFGACIAVTSAL